MRKQENIGVFGGTFDPPHAGHFIIAEAAFSQLALSKVLFIPAAQAPHKRNRKAVSGQHRLAMLKAAVRGHRGYRASDIEVKRGGVSYTVDTLRTLAERNPGAKFWLIIGSDNLRDLYTWKDPKGILDLCNIAVYERPGYPMPAALLRRTNATVLRGSSLEISATIIRRLEQRRSSIHFLVPPSVERYIRRHRLYRPVRRSP